MFIMVNVISQHAIILLFDVPLYFTFVYFCFLTYLAYPNLLGTKRLGGCCCCFLTYLPHFCFPLIGSCGLLALPNPTCLGLKALLLYFNRNVQLMKKSNF
jgi:hypothetical protein